MDEKKLPTENTVGSANESASAPEVLPADADKHEDALETIKEIKAENTPKKKRNWFLFVLSIVFFPVTGIVLLFKWATRKIKLSITIKTTVIFAFLFGVLMSIYVIFIISSIENRLSAFGEADAGSYLLRLKITSVILVAAFIAVGAAIGYIASTYMMTPIRRMIKQIDEVGADNLSMRLDDVDTQDELKELTVQINEMLDELENTFERQSNFISDASHELKTPISVIQGYANMLKRWGKSDPELLDESIDTLLAEAENMKRIVQQLLLLAKIGNLSMSKEVFDMGGVLGDVVEQYKMADNGRNLSFEGSEILVETDKNMLIESVRALVDNAIKYTADGGNIVVGCKKNGEGAEIWVEDNGIGMSAENLPHIFERFYRCDKSRSRAAGSSGLGLTITKSIVETMGGKINVKSELGKGSRFTIQLY